MPVSYTHLDVYKRQAFKYGFRPIIIGRPECPIDDFASIANKIKEYKPDIFILSLIHI